MLVQCLLVAWWAQAQTAGIVGQAESTQAKCKRVVTGEQERTVLTSETCGVCPTPGWLGK